MIAENNMKPISIFSAPFADLFVTFETQDHPSLDECTYMNIENVKCLRRVNPY